MDKDMDSGHSCTWLRYRRIHPGTVHHCTSRTAIQQYRTAVPRYCTTGCPAILPDRTACEPKAPQSVYRAPRKVAGWPICICGWLADISSPRAGGPHTVRADGPHHRKGTGAAAISHTSSPAPPTDIDQTSPRHRTPRHRTPRPPRQASTASGVHRVKQLERIREASSSERAG